MFNIIVKDPEKTWAVCNKCGGAFDVRKGGGCKCGNVKAEVDKRGAVYVEADDSDELFYDDSK